MLLSNYTPRAAHIISHLKLGQIKNTIPITPLHLCSRTGREPRLISKQMHKHSFFEVHYVIAGEITYDVEQVGEIILFEGDMLLISPEKKHTVIGFSNTLIKLALNFTLDKNPFFSEQDFLSAKKSSISRAIVSTLDEILTEAEKTGTFQKALISNRIEFLALSALYGSKIKKRPATASQVEKCSSALLIDRIERYIKDNEHLLLTCEAVAAECHFNVKYLSRVFKERNGVSLLTYIHNQKNAQAKQMLENSELSVSDISAALGFSTPQYFSIFFRKMNGITPLDYKKSL